MSVEEHYSEKHGDDDDSHDASVEVQAVSGQISVLEATPVAHGASGAISDRDRLLNIPETNGNVSGVSAVAAARFFPTLEPSACEGRTQRERHVDDDGLLRRAASGDTAAFREIFLRHRSDVARLVYRMLSRPSDLEDVVQEVFVQVFRSLKDFRGQSKFSTWLHRVTVNVVLMHRRSAKSRPVLTEEAPGDLVSDERQVLPDEDAERSERVRAFQRLLSRLAEKKRVVFVLHELEGLAPAEIAEIVGAPVLTVRTRLFYARRELEAMLADEPSLASVLRDASPRKEGA